MQPSTSSCRASSCARAGEESSAGMVTSVAISRGMCSSSSFNKRAGGTSLGKIACTTAAPAAHATGMASRLSPTERLHQANASQTTSAAASTQPMYPYPSGSGDSARTRTSPAPIWLLNSAQPASSHSHQHAQPRAPSSFCAAATAWRATVASPSSSRLASIRTRSRTCALEASSIRGYAPEGSRFNSCSARLTRPNTSSQSRESTSCFAANKFSMRMRSMACRSCARAITRSALASCCTKWRSIAWRASAISSSLTSCRARAKNALPRALPPSSPLGAPASTHRCAASRSSSPASASRATPMKQWHNSMRSAAAMAHSSAMVSACTSSKANSAPSSPAWVSAAPPPSKSERASKATRGNPCTAGSRPPRSTRACWQ